MVEFQWLYEDAQQNLREAYKRRIKSDDSKRRKINYHIGVLVMRCLQILSSAADAILGNLASRFQGLCQIVLKAGANVSRCCNFKEQTFMKPYHSRTSNYREDKGETT